MNDTTRSMHPDLQELPKLTFRQLEVFFAVCRETSYANAALELRSTRANIKRVCEDLEKAVGRQLINEGADRTLQPTAFAKELLAQTGPLSRGLRNLAARVQTMHEKGRIVRFAAAGEFFRGGLFTDFLARLQISDAFRPCFLRIESNRFRTALLNAECDVYFGAGITASDRLEAVSLGPIPWSFKPGECYSGSPPTRPADLIVGKWWIVDAGDPATGTEVLEAFHSAGAVGGRILKEGSPVRPTSDEMVLSHDIASPAQPATDDGWPRYQFSAILKKQHPYSELMPRLMAASLS